MFSIFPPIDPNHWEMTMKLNPYINFNGKAAEALRFYQEILGGDLQLMRIGDSPMAADFPADQHDNALHGYLAFDGNEIMATDCAPNPGKPHGMSLTLQIPEADDTQRIFDALAEGGTVQMPLAETFWSPAFGVVEDRFGISWMVSCTPAAVAAA